MTLEAVASAVQSLLAEDRYRLAAENVQAEIAKMPDPTQVADILHTAFR